MVGTRHLFDKVGDAVHLQLVNQNCDGSVVVEDEASVEEQ